MKTTGACGVLNGMYYTHVIHLSFSQTLEIIVEERDQRDFKS